MRFRAFKVSLFSMLSVFILTESAFGSSSKNPGISADCSLYLQSSYGKTKLATGRNSTPDVFRNFSHPTLSLDIPYHSRNREAVFTEPPIPLISMDTPYHSRAAVASTAELSGEELAQVTSVLEALARKSWHYDSLRMTLLEGSEETIAGESVKSEVYTAPANLNRAMEGMELVRITRVYASTNGRTSDLLTLHIGRFSVALNYSEIDEPHAAGLPKKVQASGYRRVVESSDNKFILTVKAKYDISEDGLSAGGSVLELRAH